MPNKVSGGPSLIARPSGLIATVDGQTNTANTDFSASWTDITFQRGSWLDLGDPTKIRHPNGSGWVKFYFMVDFAVSTAGSTIAGKYRLNGVDQFYRNLTFTNIGNTPVRINFGLVWYYDGPEDYLEFVGWCTRGGAGVVSGILHATPVYPVSTMPGSYGAVAKEPSWWGTRTATQSVSASTDTPVQFDGVVRDGGCGMWYPTLPSRIYAPSSGWYLFDARIVWANANTTRRMIGFKINGQGGVQGTAYQQRKAATTSLGGPQCVTTTMYLRRGDYVEVIAFNSTATTVTGDGKLIRIG